MYFSTPTNTLDPYAFATFSTVSSKHVFLQSSTIHSTKVRQGVFSGNISMGKLRNAFIRNGTPSSQKKVPSENTSQSVTGENWRKKLIVDMDQETLEKGLREYLGIAQPFRAKTSSMTENSSYLQRARTSNSNSRPIYSRQSTKSMKRQLSGDSMLRRDLMCNVDETHAKDFIDEHTRDKYHYITFLKAPSKEFLKLLKLGSYDVTLVPSDSRRALIEAIMRDYFLNLIPENSDFLITKNSQSQIYSIVFTGKLVPVCKICSSVGRFELSKDLGFQIVCSSQYCTLKILYRNKLSHKTSACLWPTEARADIERSVSLKELHRTPTISKMIQSGKYKKVDFSRVLLDTSASPGKDSNARPSTTANVMRTSTAGGSRIIIKGNFMGKSPKNNDAKRPNTVDGLGSARGLKGGKSFSTELKNFRGIQVLKDLDEKGLFAKDEEEPRAMEEVNEEAAEYDEKGQSERKAAKFFAERGETRVNLLNKKELEYIDDHFVATAKNSGIKTILTDKESANKLDNSFEDIHDMVNILSKESKI